MRALAKNFSPATRDKIISCFTFSKSYAMTGWRLGYTACSGSDFADNIKKIEQKSLIKEDEELISAPKIFKEDCRIDWHSDIGDINNFIRGLSPYPAAWTELQNDEKSFNLKIFNAEMIEGEHNSINGEILSDNKSYLYITTNGGLISLNELQLQGKKKMRIVEFLNGFNIEGYKLK